jgi:membrane protein implicated in regulation of membrane protease activity
MSAGAANRSIPEVFSDLVGNLTTLLQKEGQLARSEISDKITHIATGVGFAMVGAVLAIPALVILLQAIVGLLVQTGLSFPLAAVLVGGITLVIGILLLIAGVNRVQGESLVPEKTIHQLQRDAQVVKQETSGSHDLNRAA